MTRAFLSAPPGIEISGTFDRPFENAVATARTCYSSKGIVNPAQVSGDRIKDPVKKARRGASRDRIAQSIYKAGHHTTLQHAHFQFTMTNVSRQFIWSFLHSHPFYNSEQVSQRYVEVSPGSYAIPPLEGAALTLYVQVVDAQTDAYRQLIPLLEVPVGGEYFARFPARRRAPDKWGRDIRKKAQEVARYVLPVATFAYLYHTVSGLTLLRYYRLCEQFDTPLETRIVVQKMLDCLLAQDPLYRAILEEPIALEETIEFEIYQRLHENGAQTHAFIDEFDEQLGGRTSVLVDYKGNGEQVLASSVREVLGLPRGKLSDEDAIALVLSPAHNRYLGENLNLGTLSKLMRCMQHPSYTFRKKLSHTADSQDQRHRMTPGSRPILAAHLTERPDYIMPAIVTKSAEAEEAYRAAMDRAWDGYARLLDAGVPQEFAQYLLPNALAVRFTESGDLLALHHKITTRLCYNAQEEIWRACLDELNEIARVHPAIARHMGPPCQLRKESGAKPICPEGPRYCGVPVWKIERKDYRRLI